MNRTSISLCKLFLAFLLFAGTVCCHAKTMAHRYGCDTLFLTGTFKQLEAVHQNIQERLQAAYDQGNKEEVAVLLALGCENLKAIGFYKDAAEYGEKSIEYFEDVIKASKGTPSQRVLYDYATALMDMANLGRFLMENSDVTTKRYHQAADKYLTWIKNIKKTKSLSPIDRERLDEAGRALQDGSFSLSLLCHDYAGAYKEANTCIKEALERFPKDAESHIEYALALERKAVIYEKIEEYEKALAINNQILGIIKKSIGDNNQVYANTLLRIAGLYYQLNDVMTAFSYFKKSYETYIRSDHEFCYAIGACLQTGALITMSLGDIDSSLSSLETARSIINETCGETSYPACSNELSEIYALWAKRDLFKAKEKLEKLLDNDVFMSNLSSDAPIKAITLYADLNTQTMEYDVPILAEKTYEGMLSDLQFAAKSTVRNFYIAMGRAYQSSGRRMEACPRFEKALALQREIESQNFCFLSEEQRASFWNRDYTRFYSILLQNRTGESGYNALGTLLYDAALLQKGLLLDATVNLAWIVDQKGDESLKQKMELLRQMTYSELTDEQKESFRALEAEIQKEARQLGDFTEHTNITWQDVRQQLKDHEVAVEFVCSEKSGVTWYSAEILRNDMKQPYHLFLFCANNGKMAIRAPEGEFNDYAKKHIWSEKLLEFFKPGDHVYFSPVGELHKLPIEYMKLSNGKYIHEIYNLHRVSSTRVLARRGHDGRWQKDIVLFGGLNYNTSVEDMELQAANIIQRGQGNQQLHSQLWGPLPGTLEEVKKIAPIMKDANYKVRMFVKDEGVEEAFKSLSESKTGIIHVATHGYFLPSSSTQSETSGLIMTGGNNYWLNGSERPHGETEDGILTEEEIAHLNLMGTDLVVLSACQTGLGDISGEGVFGLQRSFKKAGVHSLLMSLWEVDDRATQMLMTSFYQHYASGKSKSEALRLAQQELHSRQFMRGGKEISGADPYFWSAFILVDK